MVNSSNDVRLSCMEIALRRRRDQTRVVARLSGSLFIVIKQLDEWEGASGSSAFVPPRRRTVGWFAGGRLARSAKRRPCLPAEISRDTDGGHYLTREVRASQKELSSQTSVRRGCFTNSHSGQVTVLYGPTSSYRPRGLGDFRQYGQCSWEFGRVDTQVPNLCRERARGESPPAPAVAAAAAVLGLLTE